MSISRVALIFIVSIVGISIFCASVSNIITVNVNSIPEDDMSFTFRRLKDEDSENDFPEIGNSSDHLLWFLQVSDIHISIFHDMSRVTEFKEFCDLTINTIKPTVVLASGDLTDAKSEDNMGSRQFVQEWEYYRSILSEAKITEKTVWLDIRGNHDNFNVPSLYSNLNYYRNYSIQGRNYPKSYMKQIKKSGKVYSFIALDACLEPGPRRPFNFVGVLTLEETQHIQNLLMRSSNSDFIIWFGHYPTSCILSPGPQGARGLIGQQPEALAYLCGHFHMLGGVVPNMYTLQHAGFLELELADWKDNRMYRLGVIDHGLFSFVDVAHRDWPVVLVTNPKHALYVMPSREPLEKIRSSKFIRILAFSLAPLEKVIINVDGNVWQECEKVEGPLYVAVWNPEMFSVGLHNINVYVKDLEGREKTITQPFSLDGSRMSFKLLPRIALMSNISMVFQFLFGLSLVGCVVPLCIMKVLHKLVKARKIRKPKVPIKCLQLWIQKMWVLSTVDRIFYPLVLYPLYLTVGPWSVGEIIEGYTGIIFAWGTIINGSYLPGSFTYAYGFLQMCTFQFPLTVFLAHQTERRYHQSRRHTTCTLACHMCHHVPFLIIIALQMMFAYCFWLAYGTMAFFLGPLRTWSIVLAIALWYLVKTLPAECLRESAVIWGYRISDETSPNTEGATVT